MGSYIGCYALVIRPLRVRVDLDKLHCLVYRFKVAAVA